MSSHPKETKCCKGEKDTDNGGRVAGSVTNNLCASLSGRRQNTVENEISSERGMIKGIGVQQLAVLMMFY